MRKHACVANCTAWRMLEARCRLFGGNFELLWVVAESSAPVLLRLVLQLLHAM